MQLLRILLAIVAALTGLLLALPVLVLALPFAAVAWLTGALARRIEPRFLPWHQLVDFDPHLGWRPKPDLDVHYLSDRDPEVFHVVTGPDGWPGRTPMEDAEIVVFGDSYAFGFGIDAEAAFSAGSDPRVKAIGAPGYNLVQELLLMRELAPDLSGRLVVWFVYFGNDLYDNLVPEMSGYRTPFLVRRPAAGEGADGDGDWEIVTHHVRRDRWTSSTRRDAFQVLASLHARTPLAEKAFSACDHLIGAAASCCAGAGAGLVVVGLPSPRTLSSAWLERLAAHHRGDRPLEPDLPDRELARVCAAHGVPFVSGRAHLDASDYRPVDDHWNERGHRRMRELLRQIRREHASAFDGGREQRPEPEESPVAAEASADAASAHRA